VKHRQGIIGYRSQQAAAPKPPGRLEQAARRHARAARPYLIAVAAAEALAVIAAAWLGFPLAAGSLLGLGLGVGAAGHHAFSRLWEAVDIRRNGGKRAARQRRKYQGTATWRDTWKHLSAQAARRKARFTRPQTSGRLAAHEAGVHVGTAHKRRLYITWEDSALLIGIRAGKSAFFADAICDAPGAVAAFSVRPDLRTHTAVPRGAQGHLWTLNPGGYGNIPTNVAWSPLDGCETARGAIRAAGYLMAAAPQDKDKDAFWIQQAHTLLRLYMHAAVLGGATILDVRDWVGDPYDLEALDILERHPMAVPDWARELGALQLGTVRDSVASGVQVNGDVTDSQQSVQSTALSALAWLADPAMAAIACAPPNEWFDAEQFIEDATGTLYVIGGDDPHNPLTPFLSCLNGHLFETATRLGAASPGGRNDPPFLLACDELALTKPPLDKWTAKAGGTGVTILAGTQSPSQMESCWGKSGGDTVFDNMSVIVFGGLKVAENLEKISHACGEYDTWEWRKDPATGKKHREPAAPRRTFPPERIRGLAEGKALFLHRGVRPLVMKIPQVWDRKDYTPAAAPSPVTAPMVPLDGTVLAPAIPGHLSAGPAPVYPGWFLDEQARKRVEAARTNGRPALEEASDGQDW
jgi:hypothetical protein